MQLKWEPVGEKLSFLGVDFDETIAHSSGFPDFIPTTPFEGAREALWALKSRRGYKIIIYTARHWGDQGAIEKWCKYYSIPFDGIICGKPLFYRIIDDRNIEFRGSWNDVLDKLL